MQEDDVVRASMDSQQNMLTIEQDEQNHDYNASHVDAEEGTQQDEEQDYAGAPDTILNTAEDVELPEQVHNDGHESSSEKVIQNDSQSQMALAD